MKHTSESKKRVNNSASTLKLLGMIYVKIDEVNRKIGGSKRTSPQAFISAFPNSGMPRMEITWTESDETHKTPR